MPLRAVSSSEAAPAPERLKAAPLLSRDEIGFFSQSLSAARGQFSLATKAMCAEFGLAPRGPWIIGVLGKTPMAPHLLAEIFSVGRSLITAELVKLAEAGLILQERNEADGRRVTLSLTPLGRKAYDRLGTEMGSFLADRLSGYSRDEVMLCARLLSDFAKGN
jgi:DNA-binding MarR family transcriptional regulator